MNADLTQPGCPDSERQIDDRHGCGCYRVQPCAIVVLAFAVSVFITLCAVFWPLFTVDDSYITFRYARNLAAGFGPTFNPGQAPVEGYTTFLWMLLMTIPHLLRMDAVVFAKLLGMAATVGCLLVVFVFARRLASFADPARRDISAAVSVAIVACSPATAVHAVSGMETALFTLLTTLFLYALTRYARQPAPSGAKLTALIGLLLGLTRPEGNLLVVLGICVALLMAARQARASLAAATATLYLLPGVIYFLWRARYYGLLLPLPFYVKVAGQAPVAGVMNVLVFATFVGLHIGFLVLLGLLRLRREMVPATIAAAGLCVFFLFPRHIMTYEWRFLFPVFPLVCVIASAGLASLLDWLAAGPARAPLASRRTAAAVAWGICGVVSLGMLTDLPETLEVKRVYGAGMRTAHLALGRQLSRFRSNGKPMVIAIGDVGAVPYYSQWQTIDIFGLNDPGIAVFHRRDAEYVLSRKPDLVVVVSSAPDSFRAVMPWEQGIYTQAVAGGMARVATYSFSPQKYYLWVLARPGTPIAAHLSQVGPRVAALVGRRER